MLTIHAEICQNWLLFLCFHRDELSNEFTNLEQTKFYRGMSVDFTMENRKDSDVAMGLSDFTFYPLNFQIIEAKFELQNWQIFHIYQYVSTSTLPGVADAFADGSTAKTDLRTIFKVSSPQNSSNTYVCVDVSWLSPFPWEQEVIMDIYGTAVLDPIQFLGCECTDVACEDAVSICVKKIIVVHTSTQIYLNGYEKLGVFFPKDAN